MRHHVAHRAQVSIVHVGTIEGDDHSDVEEQGFPRGLDAQDTECLDDVVALQPWEVDFRQQHNLFHVDTIGIQDPLRVRLELTSCYVVSFDGVLFAHEDLLDAHDACQADVFEDVGLDIAQESEVFIFLLVHGVVRSWGLADVLFFLQQTDSQHQVFGIVICEDAIDVAHELLLDSLADLSHRELLICHHFCAELDAQEPRSQPLGVVVLIGELVILADPLLVFTNSCLSGVGVPENLGERGDLLQVGVLELTLHILRALLVLAQITRQEDR
mmetsp:Transcript_85617/g.178872  ORF Transcript_85617/g.178872 Transcript_85617/m.178872 type:complete len:272 (-) Transcript_85617:1560-2375(-)